MKFQKLVSSGVALALAGALSACDGGQGELSGEYGQSHGGQWFTILEFTKGNEVKLTTIGDVDTHLGTYKREGDSVTITIPSIDETRTLKIDSNGCLDGGVSNALFMESICKKR